MRISFEKIDGFFRIYDGTRFLTLFGYEKYDAICNSIRYLISINGGMTYVLSHYFAKIEVDSYDSIEKRLTLHNVVIHVILVLNEDTTTITSF